MTHINKLVLFPVLILFLLFTSCESLDKNNTAPIPIDQIDPLLSWNDGPTKSAIMDYVEALTSPENDTFIAPEYRIATFDNDGTLWNEKPGYVHASAVMSRFKELLKENTSLADKEPYKSVKDKDLSYFMKYFQNEEWLPLVGDLMGVPYAGMTPEEFNQWNKNWLAEWKHPKYNTGYQNLIYQPMVELIKYLQSNEFKVFVVTADEAAFLQPISQELYGIPSEMVIGTSVKLAYNEDGKITRTAEGKFLDNWDYKPRQIWDRIGKQSVFAAGNSNGDYQMLQWVAKNGGFALMVHHTDGDREDQYDKHTDKVIPMMNKEGGTIVDMKKDWKTIFATN